MNVNLLHPTTFSPAPGEIVQEQFRHNLQISQFFFCAKNRPNVGDGQKTRPTSLGCLEGHKNEGIFRHVVSIDWNAVQFHPWHTPHHQITWQIAGVPSCSSHVFHGPGEYPNVGGFYSVFFRREVPKFFTTLPLTSENWVPSAPWVCAPHQKDGLYSSHLGAMRLGEGSFFYLPIFLTMI